MTLDNASYVVTLRASGELLSQEKRRGYDLSRRAYDRIEPAGRALFLVDRGSVWPLVGNVPADQFEPGFKTLHDHHIAIKSSLPSIGATIAIELPDPNDPVERWTITLENRSDTTRSVKLVPYLEWVLNRPDADRGHTQYNRLFAEVEYVHKLNAVLAWDKHFEGARNPCRRHRPRGLPVVPYRFYWTSPRPLEPACARNADVHAIT